MRHDSTRHRRRSIRLKDYVYSQAGAYFVTICTKNHVHLFGEIGDGEMRLSPAGEMVNDVWYEIPTHYPYVEIDAFVVMPNHIHGIIILVGNPPVGADPCVRPRMGQPQGVAPTLSLPDVVQRYKTMTTKRYIDGVNDSEWPQFQSRLWQRNYWEHVIRNERGLDALRRYIIQNPHRWDLDCYNTDTKR